MADRSFGFSDDYAYPKAVEDFVSRMMREATRVTILAQHAASFHGCGVTVEQEWNGTTLTVTAMVDRSVPRGEVRYPEHAWCTNGPS